MRGGPYLKIPSFLKSDATLRENHGKSQRMLLFGVWPLLGWPNFFLGPEVYQKWPNKGVIFFCAPLARNFLAILIRPGSEPPPEGEL